MDYLVITLQLILSLSILVTLHEMGHFFPARWFGMRVEKFYLFFNPWFKLWSVQKGETEYGIGWLPLGGYVKISGMIDESMDTEQLAQEPQPWEFRSKPAWQRLIVMLGGVFVNFILGFFIWGLLLFFYGKGYIPSENVKNGIHVTSIAKEMGLKEGDMILKVGDKDFDRFESGKIIKAVVIDGVRDLIIDRNGQTQTVTIPDSTASKLTRFRGDLIAPRMAFVLDSVMAGKGADKAGLQKGDSLVALNGISLPFYMPFRDSLMSNKSKTITIAYYRNGQRKEASVTTSEKGTIGVGARLLPKNQEYFGFFESMSLGTSEGMNFLGDQIKAFGKMFSGEIKASESLGGFASIANLFPREWDWQRFWHITAVLSLILGFMNLLPIPALDGGHALFLIIEIIIRRPLPQKVMEYAQMIGFFLLIGLLLYANGLDIYRAIFG